MANYTETFTTPNQFDPKYKLDNFDSERNACPLFSLFTAYNFMNNGDTSKIRHEHNLEAAVANLITKSFLPKYIAFDELIQFVIGNYTDNDIKGTTPDIIQECGYTEIFKPQNYNKNYCIIFLKGSNFMTILIQFNQEINAQVYYVRDCHEKEQLTFNSFDELKEHLKQKYNFEQMMIVDGVELSEFSNIEYLVIDSGFMICNLDPELYDGGDDTYEIIEMPEKIPTIKTYSNQLEEDIMLAMQLQMEENNFI